MSLFKSIKKPEKVKVGKNVLYDGTLIVTMETLALIDMM